MDPVTSKITTPAELAELAGHYLAEFCRQSSFPSTVDIRIDRHRKDMENSAVQIRPVHAALKNQQLTIHLYEEPLMGISPLALQGLLDMELARCQLELEPALYRVNFKKQIRPLFSVSGSGLNLVRHLVVHLETGVKNLIAARLVMEIGHGEPLLYACYYEITPSVVEKENYQRLVPHDWIRAVFLAKKSREFSPMALLAERGPAAELESFWWHCHTYIVPEDKRILKTLFDLSKQNPVKHFSETLVEMFKLVRSQLLMNS
ncbi:hypothetical protein D1AOALGA4SA_5220 [Olavius algarvensis Delta 1 endosymbiont]|nr:hypothetical protein D1AOALGA4SA_5220 [Olavius algarvensis Delta 1 endosymbiont]